MLGRGIRLLPVPILCGKPDFLSFVFANRSQAGDVAVDRLVQEGASVMSDLSVRRLLNWRCLLKNLGVS